MYGVSTAVWWMKDQDKGAAAPAETTTPALDQDHDRRVISNTGASESELALALLSASTDCVKLFDPEGRLDFMGFSGLCAMEIDNFADVAGQYWWSLWPVAETERLRDAVRRANVGEYTRFTAFCPTHKGTPRHWDVTVSPVNDAAGKVTNVLAVSRDITDLVDRTASLEHALDQSRILRREVDHRVKNSLGIVSSLLTMQSRSVESPDAAEALRAASVRVRTIASVHDRLYRNDDLRDLRLDDYVRLLCVDIASSMGPAVDLQVSADIPQVTVAPDTLVAVGLILAELVNNAVRHAHRADAPVRVMVRLACPDPATCVLTVVDDGPGLEQAFDPTRSRGMGMQVIQSMMRQIGATLLPGRSDMGGAAFTLTFDPAVGT